MRVRRGAFVVAPALILALSLSAATALSGDPVVAARVESAPEIDGRLDEACWASAQPAAAFLRMDTTDPAQLGSQVRVLYNDSMLFIGMRCAEPDPKNIRTEAVPRDGKVYHYDSVDIMLDPTAKGDDYSHIIVNASGSVYDRACTQGGSIGDETWNAELKAASHIGKDFWSCELAIPFYALGITPGVGSAWRFNACREKKFPEENSSIAANGVFTIAGAFVKLTGLTAHPHFGAP